MFVMHLEAMDMLSGNIGWWVPHLWSPLAHYSHLVPPQKALIHQSQAAQGTPPDCLIWSPAGLTTVFPQDCIYLHILKANAWGSVFQSAGN